MLVSRYSGLLRYEEKLLLTNQTNPPQLPVSWIQLRRIALLTRRKTSPRRLLRDCQLDSFHGLQAPRGIHVIRAGLPPSIPGLEPAEAEESGLRHAHVAVMSAGPTSLYGDTFGERGLSAPGPCALPASFYGSIYLSLSLSLSLSLPRTLSYSTPASWK